MKIKEYDNFRLIKEFEVACFQITNYPNNKKINMTFARLERELANRLGLSCEEIEKLND